MTREKIDAMLAGKRLVCPETTQEAWYDNRYDSPFRQGNTPGFHKMLIDWEYSWQVKPEPTKRPMTRWEAMLAVGITKVVRLENRNWEPPLSFKFDIPTTNYEWADLTPEGPGEPHRFEVEE